MEEAGHGRMGTGTEIAVPQTEFSDAVAYVSTFSPSTDKL